MAYYASAELISHKSLGWLPPEKVLDSCIEFHAMTCGKRARNQGRSLVDALIFFNLPHLDQEVKDDMRALALMDKRNHEYTPRERKALLDYCWTDVVGVHSLLSRLEDYLCGCP